MKIIYSIFAMLVYVGSFNISFAENKPPKINCYGLPACPDKDPSNPSPASVENNFSMEVVMNFIGLMIQYVAIFAVIGLMISGVMYLFSGWEEEKVARAKRWITWSLVWVVVSLSAWFIISTLGNISFISSTNP